MAIATSYDFIHEYSIYDDLYDSITEADKEVTAAMGRFTMKHHQIEAKQFFESSSDTDYTLLLEKEGQGLLAKIGTAVMKIINSIGEFLKKLTDRFTGNADKTKADAEKVSQILAAHPELKNQIMEGLDKNWYTMGDIASFQKDTVGLIRMLEKSAIDNATFWERFKARCTSFTNSVKPVVDAGNTIVSMVRLVPNAAKAVKESRDVLANTRGLLKKFKDDVETNYDYQNASKAQAIWNAFSQMVGLTTEECKRREKNQTTIGKFIGIFSKRGQDKYNQHVADKHTASREKHGNYHNKLERDAVRNATDRMDLENEKHKIQQRFTTTDPKTGKKYQTIKFQDSDFSDKSSRR